MKAFIAMTIITIAGIISLIGWHKQVNPKTTWIYGIYVGTILMFSLFVLKGIEQYWLTH